MIAPARARAAVLLAAGLSGSTARPAAADEPPKQKPTHEAPWMIPRGGAPSVSPDGKRMVTSVTEPSDDESKALLSKPEDSRVFRREIHPWLAKRLQ